MLRAERFKRLHPDVAVHLQVENTRRCCGAVARGEADLALVGGVMPPDLEHLLQARCSAPCSNPYTNPSTMLRKAESALVGGVLPASLEPLLQARCPSLLLTY